MNKTVAILGCGWLGLPLAQALQEVGYKVHGSTTTPAKQAILSEAGIRPYLIRLGKSVADNSMADFLKNSTLLIINIPPGLRDGVPGSFLRKMEAVHKAVLASKVRHLVFVSSTSVYGRGHGEVTEENIPDPETESGKELLLAENIFRSDPRLQTIVIRPGGLIGPARHPVTRLSGKMGLHNGLDPVNLIQQADVIHLIRTVIENGHWDKIFNAVYPAHPQKHEYYTREALIRQLPVPEYDLSDTGKAGKRVISKLFLSYNYSFFSSIFS